MLHAPKWSTGSAASRSDQLIAKNLGWCGHLGYSCWRKTLRETAMKPPRRFTCDSVLLTV
jgi:hypothetical protein